MKYWVPVVLAVAVLAASGCQAVFTYSPLEFLQRDIASLSAEQKVSRARDVLESGNTGEMRSAYDALKDLIDPAAPDPELSALAADLAFGASGVTEVFSGILENPDRFASRSAEDVEDLLSALDVELIKEGAEHVRNVVNSGSGTSVDQTQYVITGAALVVAAAEEAGGFDKLESIGPGDSGYDTYQDAVAFLELGNASDLLALFA